MNKGLFNNKAGTKKSFADFMKNSSNTSPVPKNTVIDVKIIDKITKNNQQYFLVETGLKYEGIVLVSEFGGNLPNLGDTISVFVQDLNKEGDKMHLSYLKAKKAKMMNNLKKIYDEKSKIEVVVAKKINGGYQIALGGDVFAFLPQSLSDQSRELQVGEKIQVNIIMFSYENIHVSQKDVSKRPKLEEGSMVHCVVKGFNDFFVFVDILESSVEGVIHINDLVQETGYLSNSFSTKYPADLVKIGEELEAVVLSLNTGNRIILKKHFHDLKVDSSVNLEEILVIGQKYDGTIVEIKEFGLIVEIKAQEHTIHGFVHMSEIFWGRRIKRNLSEIFKVGDKVNTELLSIDMTKKRVLLGIKQCQTNPIQEFCLNNKVLSEVKGKVVNFAMNYIFVELAPGVDAILPVQELSWDIPASELLLKGFERDIQNNLKTEITAKIIELDPSKERIVLSLKRMKKDPFLIACDSLSIGKIYDCEIVAINETVLIVMVKGIQFNGIIRKSDISKDKKTTTSFTVGQVVKAKLINILKDKRSIIFSTRAFEDDNNKKSNSRSIMDMISN